MFVKDPLRGIAGGVVRTSLENMDVECSIGAPSSEAAAVSSTATATESEGDGDLLNQPMHNYPYEREDFRYERLAREGQVAQGEISENQHLSTIGSLR